MATLMTPKELMKNSINGDKSYDLPGNCFLEKTLEDKNITCKFTYFIFYSKIEVDFQEVNTNLIIRPGGLWTFPIWMRNFRQVVDVIQFWFWAYAQLEGP